MTVVETVEQWSTVESGDVCAGQIISSAAARERDVEG